MAAHFLFSLLRWLRLQLCHVASVSQSVHLNMEHESNTVTGIVVASNTVNAPGRWFQPQRAKSFVTPPAQNQHNEKFPGRTENAASFQSSEYTPRSRADQSFNILEGFCLIP